MRASRLLTLLMRLQMQGRISAATLAAEHEVSIRTIYRDVDQLSAAGVPVYAERGRHGGFALRGDYRTRLTGMTAAESETLPLAGLGRAARELGIGGTADAARLKVLASLPPEAGARAQRVAARFHLDPVAWYGRPTPLPWLPAVAEAVWRERRLKLRYESWRGEVERSVDPLGLVLKGGHWYLVAAVAGQPRTYRVENIRQLTTAEGAARRPRQFDLARYWTRASRAFEARLLRERASVRLSRAGLTLLRDHAPAAYEAATANGRRDAVEGWTVAEIPIEPLPAATRQMLSFGDEVEVLAPAELRRAVALAAARIARRHRAAARKT